VLPCDNSLSPKGGGGKEVELLGCRFPPAQTTARSAPSPVRPQGPPQRIKTHQLCRDSYPRRRRRPTQPCPPIEEERRGVEEGTVYGWSEEGKRASATSIAEAWRPARNQKVIPSSSMTADEGAERQGPPAFPPYIGTIIKKQKGTYAILQRLKKPPRVLAPAHRAGPSTLTLGWRAQNRDVPDARHPLRVPGGIVRHCRVSARPRPGNEE